MGTPVIDKDDSIVVSAFRTRADFEKLLDRVDEDGRSLVIERRGSPKAVLLSLRDYVKLAAPEPEVLKIIGEESRQNGTNKMSSREIEREIKGHRSSKKKR